jgi:hypothetical protein
MVVGGLFKSLLRKDLKYPPIAMGGIQRSVQEYFRRKDLNNPPTAVGGIRTVCAKLLRDYNSTTSEVSI